MSKDIKKLNIENSKYTFVLEDGYKLSIERHGESWVDGNNIQGNRAIIALLNRHLELLERHNGW